MRSSIRQLDFKSWPISSGPIVVFAPCIFTNKKIMNIIIRKSTGNRDGPLIFHMRDGPPTDNGPPGGTGPPDIYSSGTGPPKTTGPPMEWLVRKKSLKKS
jgi:hypothetical protein